jgi:hypothetical protein
MSVPAAFPQEDFPRNSLDVVLGRVQAQSGFYSKEKNLAPAGYRTTLLRM